MLPGPPQRQQLRHGQHSVSYQKSDRTSRSHPYKLLNLLSISNLGYTGLKNNRNRINGFQRGAECAVGQVLNGICNMMTQTHRKELIQALRTLVHKVCCEPEGSWGKVRVVESLPVCVPIPEVLAQFVRSTTHSQLIFFLPERVMQETEPTIRGLTEFQPLCGLGHITVDTCGNLQFHIFLLA
jgi:hypothetical protein